MCEFSLFVARLLIPLLFYSRTFISSNNMLFLGLRLASLNCYICMLLNTQSFAVKCVCLRACTSWVTIMGKVVWFITSLFWSLTWNHAINLLSERQNIWKLLCCTTWRHWLRNMIVEKVSHISNIYIFLLSVSVSHDLKWNFFRPICTNKLGKFWLAKWFGPNLRREKVWGWKIKVWTTSMFWITHESCRT